MRPVILHVEKKIALLEFIIVPTFIIIHHSPDDLSHAFDHWHFYQNISIFLHHLSNLLKIKDLGLI